MNFTWSYGKMRIFKGADSVVVFVHLFDTEKFGHFVY